MIFLVTLFNFAFAAPQTSLVAPYPANILKNEVVKFQPQSGHHFSNEAPQKCGSGGLVERTARTIQCQFTESGETKALVNVCDDQKTFCKPIELPVVVAQQTGNQKLLEPKDPLALEKIRQMLVPGFQEGNPEEIRKLALERKQPVFAMISTEWCPPCNETKEFLFRSPVFQAASKDWFKVYIDGDALRASAWEKVIPYKVYPTMVLLDENMQELGRFMRELRQSEFSKWVEEMKAVRKDPIPALVLRVRDQEKGSWLTKLRSLVASQKSEAKDRARLLNWALDTDNKEWIEKLSTKSDYPEELRIRLKGYQAQKLEGEENKAKREAMFVELVEATQNQDDFPDYLSELCSLNETKCRAYLPILEDRPNIVSKWSGLTETERTSLLAEEGLIASDIYKTLKMPAAEKKWAEKCAKDYGMLARGSGLKVARAANQGRVHCLEAAGMNKEAEALTIEMVAAYPSEPTYLLRMARLKKKQSQMASAYQWIQKAEKLSYGYNWYSTILLKANMEIEMKKPELARTTIGEALKSVNLPADRDYQRNARLVERLRSLQANLDKPATTK